MAKKTPVISISSGKLQGIYQDKEKIAVFKGIPYAQPPVDDLRWRPPQPVKSWSGVKEATKFSPMAFQLMAEFEKFIGNLLSGQGWSRLRTMLVGQIFKLLPLPKQSEDCLYLNVRTPNLDANAKLPVMVWIHGGDHHDGSGSDVFYDSNALAHHDVVVVSINYRLGLMGYFAHPDLSAESENNVSGNYGTLDQIAALQWIQENVSAFGGDPNNVTIFGESAGGESVIHMMSSPLARGLFQKAISQSPANAGQMIHLKTPFLDFDSAENIGRRFAETIGATGDNQVEQLRAMSPEKLY
ncbi:MAG: carboxylesterase family protein, partial [Chloroflexota bacterium]